MKRRSRNRGEAARLEMTPMIDVVFLLLIFFIVTIKQEDILSHLDVFRPSHDTETWTDKFHDLLQITVYNQQKHGGEGFSVMGRGIALATLEKHLTKLASYSKNVSIVIRCEADSPHANLIGLLDVCSKVGLKNLSVFSI